MAIGFLHALRVLFGGFGATMTASRLYGKADHAHRLGNMEEAYLHARSVVDLVRKHPHGRESPPLLALMLTSTVLLDKAAAALKKPAPIAEIEDALAYAKALGTGPETREYVGWLEHRREELHRA